MWDFGNFDWGKFVAGITGLGNLGLNIYGAQKGPSMPSFTPAPAQQAPQAAPFEMPDFSEMMSGWMEAMAAQQSAMQNQFAEQQALLKDQQMKGMASQAGRLSKDLAARGITSGAALFDPASLAQYAQADDSDTFMAALRKYGKEFGLDFGEYA